MVTIYRNNKSMKVEKLAYSVHSKITSFLDTTPADRSNQKIYIMQKFNPVIYVKILGEGKYEAELAKTWDKDERDFDVGKLMDIVIDFEEKYKYPHLLIDDNIKILAYAGEDKNFHPYDLEHAEKLELNVTNCYSFIDSMNKNKDYKTYIAFPDLMRSFDYYSAHNLAFLLTKSYIEGRFPVVDAKKLENKRLITFQAFDLIFYHLKSLLKIKEVYKDTVKTGFDNLSKMNLLPYVPEKSWYTKETLPNLHVKKLQDLFLKKETIIGKIAKKLEEKNEAKEVIDIFNNYKTSIPSYYSNLFDNKSPIISWKDFVHTIYNWETDKNVFIEDFYIVPRIIIPDTAILNLEIDDIMFMGFDGENLHLVLNSKTMSEKETPEEVALKMTLQRLFLGRYGLEATITFDTHNLKSKEEQLDLLDNYTDD